MKPGHFSSCPGQMGSDLLKVKPQYSQDSNISNKNTSSQDEKHSALLSLPLYNNNNKMCLFV